MDRVWVPLGPNFLSVNPRVGSSLSLTFPLLQQAPLGVPLGESFGPLGVALPRAGFFIPEKPLMGDKATKAGMQIRNLLNDVTPDEEVRTPARDDWFGGNGGDTGSVTTEDESDAPPKPRSPVRPHPLQHRSFERERRPTKEGDPFPSLQEGRRYSDGPFDSPSHPQYQHPPIPSSYTSVSPYPRDALRAPERPLDRAPAAEQHRGPRLEPGRPIPLAGGWTSQRPPFPSPYGPASATTIHFRYNAPSSTQDRYPQAQPQPQASQPHPHPRPPPQSQPQANVSGHPRFPSYASESRTW